MVRGRLCAAGCLRRGLARSFGGAKTTTRSGTGGIDALVFVWGVD